ncbi:hypothetical protein [Pseudomonas oryziphila]|uniref:Phage tail protein n=1 Tax=Pseudomonas entomophila TaxID=312306 RepID=A0A3Q8U298_9PSED|nr:hypothetical protein [Pseudomonas oryziphila]AZL69192.1 hypothetical protein EJA05_16315 [Pseudomonas oryziphila]
MKRLIVNALTGEQLEVDCKCYRDENWVVLSLADFEDVPDGFFEFDPSVDIRPDPQGELDWAAAEIADAKDKLEAITFDDPNVPGTADDWKAYGRALRAWKEGAAGFPQVEQRPSRPA